MWILGPKSVARLAEIAEALKAMDGCAASHIEGQPCIVRDVRYYGRELARMCGTTGPASQPSKGVKR